MSEGIIGEREFTDGQRHPVYEDHRGSTSRLKRRAMAWTSSSVVQLGTGRRRGGGKGAGPSAHPARSPGSRPGPHRPRRAAACDGSNERLIITSRLSQIALLERRGRVR
jgi:hypothetical protein